MTVDQLILYNIFLSVFNYGLYFLNKKERALIARLSLFCGHFSLACVFLLLMFCH